MPIPAGVSRISILGTFGSGDIFDASLWYQGLTIASDADAAARAAAFAGLLTTAPTKADMSFCLGPNDNVTAVKIYHYATGGSAATYIGTAGVSGMPGTGLGEQGLQACVVMTFLTALSGRKYKGRIYWPATGLTYTGNNYHSSDLTSLVTGFTTLLNAYTAAETGSTPVVVSATGSVATPVVQIRTDSKTDIQRRRANKQAPITTVVTAV